MHLLNQESVEEYPIKSYFTQEHRSKVQLNSQEPYVRGMNAS